MIGIGRYPDVKGIAPQSFIEIVSDTKVYTGHARTPASHGSAWNHMSLHGWSSSSLAQACLRAPKSKQDSEKKSAKLA